MRTRDKDEFAAGLGLSVTEAARRAQLIDATIVTIAELGYANASFARIVERAGLSSTRMISYHFAGKDDLMMATVGTIVDNRDTFLTERLGEVRDRRAMLRTTIESEVAFIGAYPAQAKALAEIGRNAVMADGTPMFQQVVQDLRTGRLERQLMQGQREGVFGDFAPEVMALAIWQGIDGVAMRLNQQPTMNVDHYGRELADLYDRATEQRR